MAKTEQMKIFIMNFFSKCFQIGMKSCGFGYFYWKNSKWENGYEIYGMWILGEIQEKISQIYITAVSPPLLKELGSLNDSAFDM